MAIVTPKLIKELRERTAAGMTDCKNALIEADGDVEKAVDIIIRKGKAKSANRASATAAEGEIRAVVSPDKRSGTLVEINIQTDFAARSDQFKSFVQEVAKIASTVESIEDVLSARMVSGQSVADARDELIATIGEKIDVRRMRHLRLGDVVSGSVHSYVHNGKIGVLLAAETDNDVVAQHEAFAKFVDDTAMQIAAMCPLYLRRADVPDEVVQKQIQLFKDQLRDEGKPEAAWPKILEGKLDKYYSETVLPDQASVVVVGKSVNQVCSEAAAAAGGTITLLGFVRFELGEGISRTADNFAEEATKMAGV